MQFCSTRGFGRDGAGFGLEECLMTGYAKDGGLFMPERLPKLSVEELASWHGLAFQDVAFNVLTKFTRDHLPEHALKAIIEEAFETFSAKEIVPIVDIGDAKAKRLISAELFHGPTYSFKDFGQQILCRMLDYYARKRSRTCTVLVSTTGDTGPAAIAAIKDTKKLRIICFYPKGQISRLQELQMTTVDASNVKVYPFQGTPSNNHQTLNEVDDMDFPIKTITSDAKIQSEYALTSVNSINIGRILAQTVHYIYLYLKVLSLESVKSREEVVFSVPTGAMGNVTAGLVAGLMGLPVSKFVCGVNANDILHRTMLTGEFRKKDMERTLSEAINIQVPYNFERVLYLLNDQKSVKPLMEAMEAKGSVQIPEKIFSNLKKWIVTSRVEDVEMLNTIKTIQKHQKYLPDPHSAVGIAAAIKFANDEALQQHLQTPVSKIVCLATAHPCKFERAIRKALGDHFWDQNVLNGVDMMGGSAKLLLSLPEVNRPVFAKGQNWTERLRSVVVFDSDGALSTSTRSRSCSKLHKTTLGIFALGLGLTGVVVGYLFWPRSRPTSSRSSRS